MLAQLYHARNRESPRNISAGIKETKGESAIRDPKDFRNSSNFYVTSTDLFNHTRCARGECLVQSSRSIGHLELGKTLNGSTLQRDSPDKIISRPKETEVARVKKYRSSKSERRCADIDKALLETLGENNHNMSPQLSRESLSDRRSEFFLTVFNTGKFFLVPPLLNEENATEALNYENCPFEENYYFALQKLKLLQGY